MPTTYYDHYCKTVFDTFFCQVHTFSLKSCLSEFIFILSLILDELINTHVDPVLIRRTVRQSVRERSRSPLAQPAPHYRERLTERSRYVN